MIEPSRLSRRHFMQTTLGTAAAASLSAIAVGQMASDSPIRIGIVGCGGRGTGAALDAVRAATHVIYPMCESARNKKPCGKA